MNTIEYQMLDILKKGKDEFGYVGVKAEFEAEGTRIDELLRLIDIARKADLKIALKIGGCEAMKDLMEVKQIGVDYVIAPMVESSYAMSKFIEAKNKIYNEQEQKNVQFLTNMETINTWNDINGIIKNAKGNIDGLVFGRVDFTMSLGMNGREDINKDVITQYVKLVSEQCRDNNLEFVLGGGISIDAIPVVKYINNTHLSRYETRKILFNAPSADNLNAADALLSAVEFELLWLKNKREYYGSIFKEDNNRIDMLEKRWKNMND